MARSPASVETSSLNVTCSWPPADASQVRAGSADDDGEGDGPPAPPADARADGVAADVRVAAGWARAGVGLAGPAPAVAREGGAGVGATLAWVTPHPEMTATAATVTTANLSLMADPFAKGSASFRTVAPGMSVQLRTGSATQRGYRGTAGVTVAGCCLAKAASESWLTAAHSWLVTGVSRLSVSPEGLTGATMNADDPAPRPPSSVASFSIWVLLRLLSTVSAPVMAFRTRTMVTGLVSRCARASLSSMARIRFCWRRP